MNVYFRFPAQAKECFLAGATSPSDVSDICSRITYANEEDIHSLMSGFLQSGRIWPLQHPHCCTVRYFSIHGHQLKTVYASPCCFSSVPWGQK